MRFADVLRTAFMNLWRRKLRAFLTVLGMVIGTASIVIMVSLGLGIQKATIDSFAGTGSLTTIQVNSYRWEDGGPKAVSIGKSRGGSSTETKLDKKSVEAFMRLPGVKAVMPVVTTYGSLKSGKYVTDISILGADLSLLDDFGIELAEGKLPKSNAGSNYEFIMSAWTLNNFYDPNTYQQAIDRQGNPKVTLKSRFQFTFDNRNIYPNQDYGQGDGSQTVSPGKMYTFKPSGMLSEQGNDFTWYCIMDIDLLKKLARENKDFITLDTSSYNQVMVKCNEIDDVKAVKTAIDDMGYGTYSLMDAIEMAEESTKRIQYLLGAIGGVSLLVAAIGITNTMMMSIYERTKEIGIIKVLGCNMGNIAALFLSESAFIGLFGGALGLLISYGLSFALNMLLKTSGLMSLIPVYLAVGSVAFSIVVALVSGLYPALRAMRLSPLSAIRNE